MKHKIKSKTNKGAEYEVEIWNGETGIEYRCTCPDNQYRGNKCKHIREALKKEKEVEQSEETIKIEKENYIDKSVVLPVNTEGEGRDLEAKQETTLETEFREAKMMIQSGLLPSRFKTPQQVMTAYRFAKESGLEPLTAMRQLAVINGTPTFYGDLPLSVVENSGHLDSINEFLIDKEYNKICLENKNLHSEPWGAVCVVKRKGDSEPCERFFTIEDAKKANLFKNNVWKQYTSRMLIYRARSQALKDKFPDCLNGISIAEYDYHATNQGNVIIEDSTEKKAEDLNKMFS